MCIREELAKNFMRLGPTLFKKISLRPPEMDVSMQQLGLLFLIQSENGKPMKYYGERMMISRPNLTVMADRFIAEGLVERGEDPEDRRVVILRITEKGAARLAQQQEQAIKVLSKRFEAFDDRDVERLNQLFTEISLIFDRMADS